MDINFSCGYYIHGQLLQISADLNVSKEYYKRLKQVLKIKKAKDMSLVRVGLQERDGGYLMLNSVASCGNVAYSFGICNDVSWDSTMAGLGYDVYMYDHTIEKLPYELPKFHFYKEGISGKDEQDSPLKTLDYYIKKNGHSENNNMILKMDVEGAEWDFLETVNSNTLQKFDQIVFELHNIVQAGWGDRILDLLTKLNKTHQLVHLHGNNSGYLITIDNQIFPNVLEATYVLKDKYQFVEDAEISLPLPADAPNDIGRPDVVLGKWNQPLE